MNYTKTIEKSKAYNNLMRDYHTGRFSHAFLFVNEDKDYLLEFAKKVCLLILKDESLEKRIYDEVYPDVILLGKQSKITSADASFLASDVYVRGYENDKKIYILIDTDEMNDESQNKILKTLEEPPHNIYIIMLARNTKSLLPTILSRVSMVELDKIAIDDIIEMLVLSGIDKTKAEEVAPCSGNNAKLALRLAEDRNFNNLYENTLKMFETMNSSKDILDFANIFNDKTIDKKEWINLIMLMARDLLILQVGQNALVLNKVVNSRLEKIKNNFSTGALTKIIETCLRCQESLLYNVNSSCIVDELLLKFVEAKVTCKK